MPRYINKKRFWSNRRRMAWLSLLWGLIYPIGAIFAGDNYTEIAVPFYTFVSTVVVSYIGFSTFEEVKKDEKVK